MEISSILTNRSPSINNVTSVHEENKTPKVNQENVASTIRKSHAIKKNLIDIPITRAGILTSQFINITQDENN
jgi:hypothetical protein